MERLSITAEKRTENGKGAARTLRRAGVVPAVLYREGKSESIKLPKRDLAKLINASSGEQVMVDLNFPGGEKKLALLKDFQVDPVNRELLHTDFFEVSLTEKVRVTIHVSTHGEPIGVKRDKGLLQHVLREIEIECLPDNIPGKIDIDISKLELGKSVHVGDLDLGADIKIMTDKTDVIVSVAAPEAEAAAGEAGAQAAEPEVVAKKGKKEEEGGKKEK